MIHFYLYQRKKIYKKFLQIHKKLLQIYKKLLKLLQI